MNRIDRLQAILIQLQTKKVITAKEIADRFEISLRTVYRDIRALEEGGVPIGAEAGLGYYLLEGYHLPPVMFTREEALSLLIAEKFILKITDKQSQGNFQSALSKIKAVLDTEKKEVMQNVSDQIVVDPWGMQFRDQSSNILLSKIQESLPLKKVIKMNYWSNYKDEFNERIVEPIGICFYGSQWHLIAWCRLRDDYRDFRVDRIEKLNIMEDTFDRSKRISIQSYLDSLMNQSDLVMVKAAFKKSVTRYIQDAKYQYGWLDEKEFDDEVEMNFAPFSFDYIGRWLLMFGDSVRVVEPEDLQIKMRELVSKLNSYYSQ